MATVASRPNGVQPAASLSVKRDDRLGRGGPRKKEKRAEIWSNLLRQTREAQARNRAHAIQARSLIVCGGNAQDQAAFLQSIARPAPLSAASRLRDQRTPKLKGEVKLSNRFAYGYGYVTLYSPPQQGAGLLETDADEAAMLEIHTLPDSDPGYSSIIRGILTPSRPHAEERAGGEGGDDDDDDDEFGLEDRPAQQSVAHTLPSVAILLSWKEPWKFLDNLRKWLQLISIAFVPPGAKTEDPLDIIKESGLPITVVVQHVEAQEELEREGYKEESFDQISQYLRTCVLPIAAAVIYTNSSPPPQALGAPLTEIQKVLYTSLGLDLVQLSPAAVKGSIPTKREDLAPRHNVVDRMAIVVPSGWDSVGKIRLLSEGFSPESALDAWLIDLAVPLVPPPVTTTIQESPESKDVVSRSTNDTEQAVYATSDVDSDSEQMGNDIKSRGQRASAIAEYGVYVQDPHAHKAPKPPTVEVTTTPDQEFLGEMRSHLQDLEAQDAARAKTERTNTGLSSTGAGRMIGLPTGEQTGALNDLGDVSFNVGGVSYNTASAEAAIERLRRPRREHPLSPSTEGTPRTATPHGRRGEDAEATVTSPLAGSVSTPSGKGELPSVEKLEEYFASLMKKGGGGVGNSASNTPSKPPPSS